MNQIKAEYIDHMGGDLRVTDAARVSFSKQSEPLYDGSLSARDGKLIDYLAEHDHWTPFAHCMITLRETVPIFVARQRFKHTVGFTYNEESRRYVDSTPAFYTPTEWRKRPEGGIKQGSGGTSNLTGYFSAKYAGAIGMALDLYNEMINDGIAPEMARMILPQSMMTSYYVTGSLAAFARAYKQRSDSHAQLEIQHLATQWDGVIRPLFPHAWAALVGERDD